MCNRDRCQEPTSNSLLVWTIPVLGLSLRATRNMSSAGRYNPNDPPMVEADLLTQFVHTRECRPLLVLCLESVPLGRICLLMMISFQHSRTVYIPPPPNVVVVVVLWLRYAPGVLRTVLVTVSQKRHSGAGKGAEESD